jgi:hypothetical protein
MTENENFERASLWGPLPPADEFLKSGLLEKQLSDFSWKSYFVAITATEIVFATSQTADTSDRIPLAEIDYIQRQEAKVLHGKAEFSKNLRPLDEGIAAGEEDQAQAPSPPDLNRNQSLRVLKVSKDEPLDDARCFEVFTIAGGFNDGKLYALRARDASESGDWVLQMLKSVEAARAKLKAERNKNVMLRLQEELRAVYSSAAVQMMCAALVFFNYVSSVVQWELLPEEVGCPPGR